VWAAIEQEVPGLQQKIEAILGERDEGCRSED